MTQDALTLAAIRDELTTLLAGGRVQRVIRPDPLSIGMEIYSGQRHQILLSAHSESARIALVDEKLRRGTDTASPLQLLLRKYVRGARLTAISQPELERVLTFTFSGAEGEVELVCEIMGRLSNLILVNPDGTVMDAAKRISARINRYRSVLPGEIYVAPPPQDKMHPLRATVPDLRRGLESEKGPVSRRLVRAAFGISPLLAREMVHRATGDAQASWPLDDKGLHELSSIMKEMLSLPTTHGWEPSIGYVLRNGDQVATAYAPYRLTHLDTYEPVDLVCRAAAQPIDQGRGFDPYRSVRQRLKEQIGEALERQRGRLASLNDALVSPEELDALQLRGSAVLAMAWAIEPGQKSLTVSRHQVTGESGSQGAEEITVRLDPNLSPSENAQAIFREYRKRESANREVPGRIAQAKTDIAYLEQLQTDVDLAESRPELDQVEGALQQGGFAPAKKRTSQASAGDPVRIHLADDTLIMIGRNSRQNELVTFRLSSPHDLWLHAHDLPGSHVIIRNGGRPVPEDTLIMAAQFAAYYSAGRHEEQVQVDITERRHVRHIPGGRPGMVTYRNEETLVVRPHPPKTSGE